MGAGGGVRAHSHRSGEGPGRVLEGAKSLFPAEGGQPMSTDAKRATECAPRDEREEIDIQGMHAPILREQGEPREGFEPINPAYAIAFGVIVFVSGYYLAPYSGDFRGDVYNENRVPGDSSAPAKPVDPLVLGQ